MKNFIFILGISFPILLLLFNTIFEYHWILDNLLGLPYAFFFWYLFIAIFCYFFSDIKFTSYQTFFIPIAGLSFYFLSIQEKEPIDIKKEESIIFSTFQYNMFQKIETIKDAEFLIAVHKPDFLIFQEVNTEMGVTLFEMFRKEYPYSIGRKPIEGFPSQQLFMSKHPILKQEINEFINKRHRFISAIVSIEHRPVYFYIMHPPSPKNKKNWKDRNYLLKEADSILMKQLNPFILIGDLNITLTSNQFRHIFDSNYYNFNPLTEGHTWRAGDIPYISDYFLTNEIDQTLTSKDIFITEKKSYQEKKESDHFPIISKFKLKTN